MQMVSFPSLFLLMLIYTTLYITRIHFSQHLAFPFNQLCSFVLLQMPCSQYMQQRDAQDSNLLDQYLQFRLNHAHNCTPKSIRVLRWPRPRSRYLWLRPRSTTQSIFCQRLVWTLLVTTLQEVYLLSRFARSTHRNLPTDYAPYLYKQTLLSMPNPEISLTPLLIWPPHAFTVK